MGCRVAAVCRGASAWQVAHCVCAVQVEAGAKGAPAYAAHARSTACAWLAAALRELLSDLGRPAWAVPVHSMSHDWLAALSCVRAHVLAGGRSRSGAGPGEKGKQLAVQRAQVAASHGVSSSQALLLARAAQLRDVMALGHSSSEEDD